MLDKLDFITFLKMKYKVENEKPGWSWRIKTFGHPFTLYLDDGDQSYFTFQFDKDLYTKDRIKEIGKQLASKLGIEFIG